MEWLDHLPAKVYDKCLLFLTRLGQFGHELRRPAADYLRSGIYELRPSYQGVNYRILYFFPSSARVKSVGFSQIVVVSHGLQKEREVPDAEIDRAIERKRKFEADPGRHTFDPKRRR